MPGDRSGKVFHLGFDSYVEVTKELYLRLLDESVCYVQCLHVQQCLLTLR